VARALLSEDWHGEPIEVSMAVYNGEAEAVDGDWLGRPQSRDGPAWEPCIGGKLRSGIRMARQRVMRRRVGWGRVGASPASESRA
jgi:hypothetical protein